jgi:probable HAF family extracellular repeat protein
MQACQFVLLPLALLLVALMGIARAAIPHDADDADFVPVDLGTLGGSSSVATAVNVRGQVVGNSTTAGDDVRVQHAFSRTATEGMVDLGTLGGGIGPGSSAIAVNARGQVVGYSRIVDGSQHAFSWTARRGMVDLGTLGGDFSQAFAVNDRGQIVGSSSTADGSSHAVLWELSR